MATHPLAIKLEEAIEHAKKVRDGLLATKEHGDNPENKPWWDWVDSLGRKRVTTRIFGRQNLGAIAAGDQSRLAAVEPGEANASLSKKALRMKADPHMAALQDRYAREFAKCAEDRQRATANGSVTLEDGSVAPAEGKKGVSIPCPKANAALKELEAYMASTYGDFGPSAKSNSGGGGGGGW